jgi:hypothetical protein
MTQEEKVAALPERLREAREKAFQADHSGSSCTVENPSALGKNLPETEDEKDFRLLAFEERSEFLVSEVSEWQKRTPSEQMELQTARAEWAKKRRNK